MRTTYDEGDDILVLQMCLTHVRVQRVACRGIM